jgi:hypothetical protein
MAKIKLVYTSNANYPLTYGKVYEAEYDENEIIYSSTGIYYKVLDDENNHKWYYHKYFTNLEDFRNQKINKLFNYV